jgi:hypothetical protein
MRQKNASFSSPTRKACSLVFVSFLLTLSFPIYTIGSVWYTETKGPFKNWTQVVDLNGDGDLDVLVSHTRWEEKDLSWAGVGRWINKGNGRFELVHDKQLEYFAAFAAGAGDADLDGDADIFVQDFDVRLLMNQGGMQGGEPGEFQLRNELNSPSSYGKGYRDMGGTITTGDLNGDGRVDALIGGCCYGLNPIESGSDFPSAPSISWIWINDVQEKGHLTGHILPMDFLNGIPFREAALGDVDGDGDLDVFAAVGKPTLGKTSSISGLLLLNDGTGQLTVSETMGNTDSTSVALGDVNGDTRLDALVGTTGGAGVWLNKRDAGTPIFFTPESSLGNTRLKSVFLADLDGDGDLDALLAGLRKAVLWWNDGQGEFSRSNVSLNYKEDTGLAVGDFDGDGDSDVFAGNNDDYYRTWLNDGTGHFKPAR